jgi:hypothetical protein
LIVQVQQVLLVNPQGSGVAGGRDGREREHGMLSGDELELWTGDQLQHRDIVRPTPAKVLHVAVNRSAVPAVFVPARG